MTEDIQMQILGDIQAALIDAMPDEKPVVRGVQVRGDGTVACRVVLRSGRYGVDFELPIADVVSPAAVQAAFAATVAKAGLAGNVLVKVVAGAEERRTHAPDGVTYVSPGIPMFASGGPFEPHGAIVTKAGGPVELPKEDALSADEQAAIDAEEAQLLADMAASQAAKQAAVKPTTATRKPRPARRMR